LRDGGHTTEVIAELLGTSVRTVQRWLQDVPEVDSSQSAAGDLEVLLDSQELDGHARFKAGIARRLAVKLDKAAVSDRAQDAMAVPQIAKELDSIVNAIMDVSSDDKEWLAGLLTKMEHPKDA
jgi:hypothetical protein